MKKRLLLASVCVAGLALTVSAHRDQEMIVLDMSRLSPTGTYMAVNDANAMWSVTSTTEGEMSELEYNGVKYPAFKYTGSAAVKLNLRHKRTSSYDNAYMYDRTLTARDERFCYPYSNTEISLKVLVKSESGSAITPSFTFRKTKLDFRDDSGTKTGKNGTATVTYKFSGSVPTDGVTAFEGYAPSFATNNQTGQAYKGLYFFYKSVYTDCNVILDGVQQGDVVAVIGVYGGRQGDGNLLTDNGWITPTVSLTNKAKMRVYNDGAASIHEDRELPEGLTIVQAEDYDEPSQPGVRTHSATLSNNNWRDAYGYSGRVRGFDDDSEDIRVDVFNNDRSVGGFCSWGPHGGSMTAVDKTTKDFGFPYFAQQAWDAAYSGAVDGDGAAELEDLQNYYGAWAQYTIDVEEELYADISLRTGVHKVNFGAYRAFDNNSPIVKGENVNYIKQYGGGYRIYVDGEPIRSNWQVRPSADYDNIDAFETWLNNADPKEHASVRALPILKDQVNGYCVYATPDVGNADGGSWNSIYKSELGEKLYEAGRIDADKKAVFDIPDFANIHLTKGKHVIKVQAMGGQTTFDEFKIQAHKLPNTPTGIEAIGADVFEAQDADAPVEYYNLQGVKVVNPQGGIFIRKQGSKVSKVVVR